MMEPIAPPIGPPIADPTAVNTSVAIQSSASLKIAAIGQGAAPGL